ncbi:hypothetical protein IP85_09575 [Rhizobium sp. AAP116]|nr:hypothetical protein IP85_09575 [Rhizobium sp. AAP116]
MNVPLNTRVGMLREACRLLVNEGLNAFLQRQTEHSIGSAINFRLRLERRIGRMCAIRAQPGEEMR